ncbi:MAG: hypothetical protein IK137_00945 [Bacilli bacterium]|nr:hypothetical protein [Bacilli bacterium]
MSSLYNKNYISIYDDEEMLNIIEGKTNNIPDPNKIEDRYNYIVLQHYLIKYIEENGKKNNAKLLLNKYYEDFIKYPHLFVDSPLLENSFLNRFIPLPINIKVHILKYKYFESYNNLDIYEILMRHNKLSNNQKNKLYSFLIYQMKNNYNKYNIEIEKCIKEILNSNKPISQLNDMELKFYCMYVAKKAGQNQVVPDVHIIKDDPNYGGYEKDSVIYINSTSNYIDGIHTLTRIVCHETRHAMQEKDAKNKNSKTAFEMARHLLFEKYINTDAFNVYKKNYKYSGIELDAEGYGYYYSTILLQTLGRKDLADKIQEDAKKNLNTRHFYECAKTMDGMDFPIDAFNVEYMDMIIKEHPEELKTYKVLRNLYNDDGTRKPLSNLISRRIKQGFDYRGIYDNYINYEISKDRLYNISLEKTPKNTQIKYFKSLSEICSDKVLLLKEYCDDQNYQNTDSNQIIYTTLYQIELLDKLLGYIDQKMDYILECKEKQVLNESSFIYNFIRDLNGFSLNNINNEVIRDNPLINQKINILKSKHQSITKKYNMQCINDMIKDLSIEEKHALIITPDGRTTQLIDYLYYDLLPNLNVHSTIHFNGKKTHISHIIKYYKSQIKINSGSNKHI